jgi:hypothetical protein
MEMDNSFQRQESDSDMQQPRKKLANKLHVFESLLHWLANLVRLTETEQIDAGIYLGHLGDE